MNQKSPCVRGEEMAGNREGNEEMDGTCNVGLGAVLSWSILGNRCMGLIDNVIRRFMVHNYPMTGKSIRAAK
jgi:hypothetical protein